VKSGARIEIDHLEKPAVYRWRQQVDPAASPRGGPIKIVLDPYMIRTTRLDELPGLVADLGRTTTWSTWGDVGGAAAPEWPIAQASGTPCPAVPGR
jgi:hypothetical protein